MTAHRRWNVTVNTPLGVKTGVLDLVTNGFTLSGSLYDAEHRVEISDGRIEGDLLTWSVKLSRPMRTNVKFTARVDGDQIEGVAKHLLGRATFRGTRI